MSFLFRSLPGCVTSVRACCWAQGRRKARPGGRVLRVSPLLMDRFPLFLCSHLWPEVSSVCHIVGLGHVPQTARLSVGAASAAPHPCPARGWSGLLGLRSRIKGVFPPLGCFLGWSCLPGPPSWEPASLEQTETDRCPCQVLRNAANKKQSGTLHAGAACPPSPAAAGLPRARVSLAECEPDEANRVQPPGSGLKTQCMGTQGSQPSRS